MTIIPSDYYLLRLPLLPLNDCKSTDCCLAGGLPKLWNEPYFAESIFIASPTLYEQIDRHVATLGWPLSKAQSRSLHRYTLRMKSRATPFGMMAGFSFGKTSARSQVELALHNVHSRHHRLDMYCLASLIEQLAQKPFIRNQLLFYPNNSRYIINGELRYTEREDQSGQRHYFLSAVPFTDYLSSVLSLAEQGATIDRLVASLTDSGISFSEALLYIEQLVENQVLTNELEPILTGPPMLSGLRNRISQLHNTSAIVQVLTKVEDTLNQPEADSRSVQQIALDLLSSCFKFTSKQHIIQTDLQLNTVHNQVSERVVRSIVNQVERLAFLQQPRPKSALIDFAWRFKERYDQQEMPLQMVLDGDYGIGYGDTTNGLGSYSPLLANLKLPAVEDQPSITWGAYENLLVTKLSSALQTGSLGVELTDDDIDSFDSGQQVWPASFYLFGNLLSSSTEALDRGDFLFNLLAAEGPSAARLLGRFCTYSQQLTTAVIDSLQREEEQRPDVIYAEIVHWPDDRSGNILVRPSLRRHEIPYISQASPEAQQIPLSDLLLSIQADGRISLRSKCFGKEVIPRLSTAHNHYLGQSIYQFLADLQYQDEYLHLGWDWKMLNDQPFLPRITYRNIILKRAQWRVNVMDMPNGTPDEHISYLTKKHRLPRWIAIIEGDKELIIDLETGIGKDVLLDEIKRHSIVQLVECVTTPDQCWIRHKHGVYVNEMVIPCERASSNVLLKHTADDTKSTKIADTEVNRTFWPGSDWLYIKLYAGTQIADELLKKALWPLFKEIIGLETVKALFFVRFADPEHHIRIRLHSDPAPLRTNILDQLNAKLEPYLQSGSIHKVQFDTYNRELERYGHETVTESEQIFSWDSFATLRYLSEETEPDDRWLFALQSCDAMLDDFGLNLLQKTILLEQLQEKFWKEHGSSQALRQQLNQQYRVERSRIDAFLESSERTNLHNNKSIIRERSVNLEPIARRIKDKTDKTTGDPALLTTIASYLHMGLNRLFASQQRAHELVVYHFLTKYYKSRQAKLLKA